jgi:hypothetical protein
MKSFDYFLFRIGLIGTKKEKEILDIGKLILKNVERLGPGNKPEEWTIFKEFEGELKTKVKNYNGKFSDYFNSMLNEIKLEERLAYGINSD